MGYILNEVAREAATNPKAVEAFAKDLGIEIPKSYEAPTKTEVAPETEVTEVTTPAAETEVTTEGKKPASTRKTMRIDNPKHVADGLLLRLSPQQNYACNSLFVSLQ